MTRIKTAAPESGRSGVGREDHHLAAAQDAAATRSGSADLIRGQFRDARERVRVLLDPPEHESGDGPLTHLLVSCAAFSRRHLRLMDSAIAAVIFGLGLLNILAVPGRSGSTVLFTSLLALPLAWRRRAPITVFLFIAAAAFAQWLVYRPLFADTALFVALYTVAVARPLRAAIVATVIVEIGAILATVRWAPSGSWLQNFALLSGGVVAAVVSGVHLRARRLYVASLLERATRLELERDQQARLAAAAERARIAREMHDVIAHSLAVVISLANGATAKLRRDPEQSRDALESISELGRRALDDTRQLLSVLRTDDGAETRAPQPGIDEIADLVDQAASTGLAATLTVYGDPAPVATGPALGAYRIVQEAITNTLKHAKDATAVTIQFTWTPHRLQIRIDDDGRPSAPPPNLPVGFGLAGMRERAALYGGSATAGPRDEGGWTVNATIPTIQRILDE
jgi:signal transduction histidine kinase